MEFKDAFLTPLYLAIILFFAVMYKKKIKEKPIKKYFIPALMVKIIGAICVGLVYQFYYKGGDTFTYFTDGSKYIWEAFKESPLLALKLILDSGGEYKPETYTYAVNIYYYPNKAAYFIVRLSGLLGLLTFHTYLLNAILFTLISFTGAWALFKTFYKIYPHLHKKLAVAIFFIPSVFFWGSGLLKDSITFGALGWCIYAFYNLFITGEKKVLSFIILTINLYILKIVKIYIALCFVPFALIWLFLVFNKKIRLKIIRVLIQPFMLIVTIFLAFLASNSIVSDNTQYQLQNLHETAKITSDWITYASSTTTTEGSVYYLGDVEFSPLGLLKIAPAGIWVSLFRPYLWEVKNVVMFVSALESFVILIFTIITLFKVNIFNYYRIFKNNPIILPCLVFTIIFAFAIGISTGNFGSLVRYKIPFIPLYLASLFIIQDENKKIKLNRKNLNYKSLTLK